MTLLVCLLGISPSALSQREGFLVTNETAGIYHRIPEIEDRLYGHAYPNQAVSQRVNRIERTLFGGLQRGPMEQRIKKIEERINQQNSQETLAGQEPLIIYLEEKLFQRSYPDKPLTERMQQLESHVFGRSYDHYPLNIRIKKISYAMPIMAKEIRLSKGDMVIASTQRTSQRQPRSLKSIDTVQLDATGSTIRALPQGTITSSGDYFQSIHRLATGKMLRWETLPIRVYVKQNGLEAALSAQAIRAWQNVFSIETVDNPLMADVIVSWERADWEQNTAAVLTRPVIHMDHTRKLRTIILISLFPFKASSNANKLHAVSHQLGHAFGLWGHSDDPDDLMYPILRLEVSDFPGKWAWRSALDRNRSQPTELAEGYAPSQRDINTLLKIYDEPGSDLSLYSPY